MVVDASNIVNSSTEMADVESKESFNFYFPDGTMTNAFGGQNSGADFNDIVMKAQSKGFTGEVVNKMKGGIKQNAVFADENN